MAVTTATAVDVSKGLADALAGIDGLRVYPRVADIARVPCVVVQLPTIDYADPSGTFCSAVWTFPLLVIVARTQDVQGQAELSTYTNQVALALRDAEVPGVQGIEPQMALPSSVLLNGQELPAYSLRVLVRA